MTKQLILFKQNGCRPCDTLSNILKYDLEVEVDRTVNLSEPKEGDIELATEFGIMTTPVLMLLNEEGDIDSCINGLASLVDLEALCHKRGLL